MVDNTSVCVVENDSPHKWRLYNIEDNPELRHSTDASVDGYGSVLQISGYLRGSIRICGCGCARISISGTSALQISAYFNQKTDFHIC